MAKVAACETYGKALAELAKEDREIPVLDTDLSDSIRTGEVRKITPEQHFNFSITGGNMMTAAAGMATSGNIVFASTFAVFAAGRAFGRVRNSICYPHLNVKVCATHAGLTISENGAGHQSVEDVALTRGIPGMVVVSPANGVETKAAIRAVTKYDGPCCVRLGRMAVEDVYTEDMLNFQIEKGNMIRRGSSVAPITTDIMVEVAMKATDVLKGGGTDVTVVDIHTIRPVDEKPIVRLTKDRDLFVTCKEYSVIGGLDSTVAGILGQKAPKKLTMVGIKDTFGESGTPVVLPEKCGLTADDIVRAVENNK